MLAALLSLLVLPLQSCPCRMRQPLLGCSCWLQLQQPLQMQLLPLNPECFLQLQQLMQVQQLLLTPAPCL